MHEDTIPSQLFPEGESSKARAPSEKPRKIGVIGLLVIATLIGLGGLAVAKLIHRWFGARKRQV